MSDVALHFSPHPDDELIGAPATLLALRAAGWRVVNVACGLGHPEQAERRAAELREATALAGFELRIPDPAATLSGEDDPEAAHERLLGIVRQEVERASPAIVLGPAPHDRHRAHELVGRALREALAGLGDAAPRWWMWAIWGTLPLPTLATAFDAARLEQGLVALAAHKGELERNDYRRMVAARAEMNASLGPELLFGFGSAAMDGCRYVELLTEVARADGHWLLGTGRWLDPEAPLAPPSEVVVDAWLEEPSVTERFGLPGAQGTIESEPEGLGADLNAEERARLWDLTLHEDTVFNQRHTLFLVAEAMLAVTYATALDANENAVAGTVAAIGLVLTVAWLYVSMRHGGKVESVQRRAKQVFEEYREMAETSPPSRLPFRSRTVAGVWVPILVCLLWVALLVPRVGPS